MKDFGPIHEKFSLSTSRELLSMTQSETLLFDKSSQLTYSRILNEIVMSKSKEPDKKKVSSNTYICKNFLSLSFLLIFIYSIKFQH